ncbi:MAG: nitroreductase family protein [Anaerolineae bacterium]|nr:nitroreductase family protein [Anaerolineae bacterium]
MSGTFRETIRVRHSTRRYADRSVPDDVLAHLLEFAARAPHLTDVPPRVTVVSGRERVGRILARYLGVYGLVQGAPHLLVGLIPEDSDRARLDLGYVLEQGVLEATRLGLSTCWMTGSYHPERAADEVERGPDEMVAATVALGYARVRWRKWSLPGSGECPGHPQRPTRHWWRCWNAPGWPPRRKTASPGGSWWRVAKNCACTSS